MNDLTVGQKDRGLREGGGSTGLAVGQSGVTGQVAEERAFLLFF